MTQPHNNINFCGIKKHMFGGCEVAVGHITGVARGLAQSDALLTGTFSPSEQDVCAQWHHVLLRIAPCAHGLGVHMLKVAFFTPGIILWRSDGLVAILAFVALCG